MLRIVFNVDVLSLLRLEFSDLHSIYVILQDNIILICDCGCANRERHSLFMKILGNYIFMGDRQTKKPLLLLSSLEIKDKG